MNNVPARHTQQAAHSPDPTPAPAPAPTPTSARLFRHPRTFVALLKGRAVVLAVACLAALFFLLTALILRADLRPTPWDVFITHEVQEFPSAPVGTFLIYVSEPGFYPVNWIIIGVLLVGFALARLRVEAAFLGLAALGGTLAEVVKNLVDRPRPTPDLAHITQTLHSYSFPSGHVTSYVPLYGFLFYLAFTLLPRRSPRRVLALLVSGSLILLVGPSRIYMGQHWASDVLAGYALGFAYLLLVIELYRAWQRKYVKRKT